MSKQIKLQSIEIFRQASVKFKEENQEKTTIPAILGIKLGLLLREITPILEEFEKSKNDLILKYGEKVVKEDKEFFTVKEENMNVFFKEISELTKIEFQINNTIDIKYFENIDLPMWYSDALVEFIND